MKQTKKNSVLKYVGVIIVSFLFLFLGACAENAETQQAGQPAQNSFPQQSGSSGDSDTPSWVPSMISGGPWKNDLYIATSTDGFTFTDGELLLEHVGVPNLLLTSSGKLIATYQYFSYETEELFGIIAYSTSDDNGMTWTDPVAVTIEGLPEATTSGQPGEVFVTRAVDPTLVETEDDALRLYFTYQEEDEEWPHLASAINSDGDISGTFIYEEESGYFPAEEAAILDPAVVFFDGLWHHYTWNVAQAGMGNSEDGPVTIDDFDNYHATSEDGITFTVQEPIPMDMNFLGQVIVIDGGLRFYGTGNGGIVSAYSVDGYVWEMDEGTRGPGNDPGVVQLEDGTFVLIYTGPGSVQQN